MIASSLSYQLDQLAANDMALKLRVRTIDQQINQLSVIASASSLTRGASRVANNEIHEDEFEGRIKPHGFVLPPPDFIEEFERSQAQRRASLRSGRMSFHSAMKENRSWTGISRITLQQLSTVSAISLPIRISDLAHGHWYTEYRWLDQPPQSTMTSKRNSMQPAPVYPPRRDSLPAPTMEQSQARRESKRFSQQPAPTYATETRNRMSGGSKVVQYLRRRSKAAQR